MHFSCDLNVLIHLNNTHISMSLLECSFEGYFSCVDCLLGYVSFSFDNYENSFTYFEALVRSEVA